MKYIIHYDVFESLNSFKDNLDRSMLSFDQAAGTSDPNMKMTDPDDYKEVKAKRLKRDYKDSNDTSNKIIYSKRKKRNKRSRASNSKKTIKF